jgi:hypothetical protein
MNDQQSNRLIVLLETIERDAKQIGTPANFYSQTVNVITIFFSTFMAIGLQKILEQHLDGQSWLCFVVAFTLFLRFLSGSANHLWFEHVIAIPNETTRRGLLWHSGWLTMFAFLGLQICYAPSIKQFLMWSGAFGLLTVVAPLIDTCREHKRGEKVSDLFYKWLLLNVAFSAAVGLAWLGYFEVKDTAFHGIRLPLAMLSFVCVILLLLDLHIQLKHLMRTQKPEPVD